MRDDASDVRLGRYVQTGIFFWRKGTAIELNRGFLAEIFRGEAGSRQYGCGHRSLYRLGLATLLHELSHVYDFLNLPATQDPAERAERQACVSDPSSRDCQRLQLMTKTVSDRPGYVHLMGLNAGFTGNRSRNVLWARSPDPYELTNQAENFAVNMEYFLLDPEFRCRRPSAFAFLSGHFGGFAPAGSGDCRMETAVRFSSSNAPASLDPDRVYQVHYLLADRGEELSSRWGHAMFRVIVCDPKRKEVGPDCLKDVASHVVLSYRANVSDVVINHVAGLTGKYPSQLFLFSLPEIVSEYTLGESRDLLSVPLKLTREQIRLFASKALEQYWEYQGRYYFLGNNCATESLHFLQGVLPDSALVDEDDTFSTPKGVYGILRDRGLLDESVLDRPDANERYRFPGFRHQVTESFGLIRQALGNPALALDDFVGNRSSSERRALYAEALRSGRLPRAKLAVQFLFLELRIREALKQRLSAEAGKLTQNVAQESGDARFSSEIQRLARDSARSGLSLAPWVISRGGYGIPRADERASDDELKTRLAESYDLRSRLFALIKSALKDVFSDLDGVSGNIQFFTSEVKAEVGKSP